MRHHVFGLTAMMLAIGCGAPEDHPLGGPYGGTTEAPGPAKIVSGAVAPDKSAADAGSPAEDGAILPDEDGGASPPPADAATPPPPPVTWSTIFTKYLAVGTVGNCAKSGCHKQMSDAPQSYKWLAGRGYITGDTTSLTDTQKSCLSWYGGGSMPPNGPATVAAATADMNAWAAAGAPNN